MLFKSDQSESAFSRSHPPRCLKPRDFPHVFNFLWNLPGATSSLLDIYSVGPQDFPVCCFEDAEEAPAGMAHTQDDASLGRGSLSESEEALVAPAGPRG